MHGVEVTAASGADVKVVRETMRKRRVRRERARSVRLREMVMHRLRRRT